MDSNSELKSNESKNSTKVEKKEKIMDLDNQVLVRGDTPEDIKERCLQLCKDYLSGNWIKQTVDTINVRRISGGLVNQLYYCGICEPLDTQGVPQEVAIKLYGEDVINKTVDNFINDKLNHVIIGLMFSNNGLGPKIYGHFEGGIIQKYYQVLYIYLQTVFILGD